MIRTVVRASLILIVVAQFACALRPRTLEHYGKDGISFSHYSDWTISRDAPLDDKPNIRLIEIHGPDHAIVSMVCLPPDAAQTLEEFARGVAERRVAAIKDKLKIGPINTTEVTVGTSESTTGSISGKQVPAIQQRFQVEVLGQPTPHTADFYLLTTNRYRVFVLTQVADRHALPARSAWKTILDSLEIEPAER